MIDNKKIEEAKDSIFNKHFLKNNEGMVCVDHILEPVYLDYQIKQAIELGAKWAINEFLKDLWHPASEEPKGYNEFILIHYNVGNYYSLSQVKEFKSWKGFVENMPIDGWLYIDDLFPKEGGGHD